jgi:tRNA1Val (adenine37-N6)-methyltransferase
MFKFKQFEIQQNKAAMKVGTDGVLLGAWIKSTEPTKILDIGTGTGLIALMLAQKFIKSEIFAIEIDKEAYLQATENANNSNWNNRIKVINEDFLKFAHQTELKFDIIVSNPPFFENQLLPPDKQRLIARHNLTLPFSKLIKSTSKLLTENGEFSVIIPNENYQNFIHLCSQNLLFCNEKTTIKHTPNKPPKRILLKFSKKISPIIESEIIIKKDSEFTEKYKQLTKDYYLIF